MWGVGGECWRGGVGSVCWVGLGEWGGFGDRNHTGRNANIAKFEERKESGRAHG